MLSFNVGAFVIGRTVPADSRGDVGSARQRFLEQLDEIDVVVLGSSRVQKGLDGELVEAELRKAGREIRVFNFGAGNMRTLEQDHLLAWILAQRPPRLEWVVLEAWPLGITLRRNTDYSRKAEVISSRSISWHTARVTWRALAAIWRFPLPALERVHMARHHIDLWARRTWNLGLLSERAFESSRGRRQRERLERGEPLPDGVEADGGGVPGFDQVLGATRERRSKPRKREQRTEWSEDDYDERASKVARQNRLPVRIDQLDLALLANRDRLAREAGVQLAYLSMPGDVGCPEALQLREAGLLGPLLHFNDPQAFPELFAKELRRTPAHLNAAGAKVFSRLFAREFLESCVRE